MDTYTDSGEEGVTMISSEEKKAVFSKYGKGDNDTGSPEVQVALLTTRINNLMPHFEGHKHDHHSRRGLFKMIGKRKSFLKYIKNQDEDRYLKIIKDLGLRK